MDIPHPDAVRVDTLAVIPAGGVAPRGDAGEREARVGSMAGELSVSIAMATYQGGRYLREQLESFAAQERRPGEVVVSDDGSTDDTAEVVAGFARGAPFPVRLERNASRLGYNGNFERAAAACAGDVILFSDQDDRWLPGHVRRIAEEFERDPAVGVVVSNSTYVDEGLRPTRRDLWTAERFGWRDYRRNTRREGQQFAAWARHRALAGHGMGLRASLRASVLPVAPGWIYDQWVAMVCVALSRAAVVAEPLTLHRHHGRQAVGNDRQSLSGWYAQAPSLAVDHFGGQSAAWWELLRRVERAGGAAKVLEAIRGKIAFLDARGRLRGHGAVGRVAGAVGHLVAGRYHRHARGLLTFARDVVG